MTKTILQELEEIREEHDGILAPEHIVEYARNPETALHDHFEWDIDRAAHLYHLEQARRIIRMHVYVIDEEKAPVRMYVSLEPDRRPNGGGYRTLTDVMNDDEMRAQLLRQALREAQLFAAKYKTLSAVAPIIAAIDSVMAAEATPVQ